MSVLLWWELLRVLLGILLLWVLLRNLSGLVVDWLLLLHLGSVLLLQPGLGDLVEAEIRLRGGEGVEDECGPLHRLDGRRGGVAVACRAAGRLGHGGAPREAVGSDENRSRLPS